MSGLLQDIRYALRQLRKSPGFTAIAIITLALGIGANTATFTVLNAVLLRPLPYEQPSRLVWLTNYMPRGKATIVGVPDFVQWRKQNHSFTVLAGYDEGNFNLTGGLGPERIHYASVTASLLPLLGVQPVAGRAFRSDENVSEVSPVVMLSHEIWQRRFGSDRSVIGTKIALDGVDHEVVGILPTSFVFPSNGDSPQILVPLRMPESAGMASKNIEMVNVIGRLRPGVTINQARSDIYAIQSTFVASSYPPVFRNIVAGFETRIIPLQQHWVGDVQRTLLVLLGAVAFLLVIACANVANLQLARATERSKELGLRAALGARKSRLARQLLTESILLSLMGCGAGVLLAFWSVGTFHRFHPAGLPRFSSVALDYSVLTFAVIIATFSGILSGLAPAVLAKRGNLNDVLKESSPTVTDAKSVRRLRKLLVISEVSLAVVLLIGSGLFIRSFLGLLQVDPGFDPHNVLTLGISPPGAKYSSPEQQRAFIDNLILRLGGLPGVVQVGAVTQLPFTGYHLGGAVVVDGQPILPPGMRFTAPIGSVTAEYFRAMRIPLIAGRYFDSSDMPSSPGVVLVSHSFAQHFFSGENPIGKRIQLGGDSTWLTIVGVIGDVHHIGLQLPPDPEVFRPLQQSPANQFAIVLRTAVAPLTLASAVRKEVVSIDQDQPIFDVATMESRLGESISEQRFNMGLLTAFGIVALVLAVSGIYGVISFYVAQRTHEIGIRIALGAGQTDVLRLVLARGTTLVFAGIAAGVALALLLTRFVSGMLFGVRPNDVWSFVGACLVLALVACLGSYIPAQRATKVDPMVALRYE